MSRHLRYVDGQVPRYVSSKRTNTLALVSGCENLLKSTCVNSESCVWELNREKQCGWCRLKDETKDAKEHYCDSCFVYEASSDCKTSSLCEWCDSGYCKEVASPARCEIRCELYSSDTRCQAEASECDWCPSADSCISKGAKCYQCSDFAENFCPRGCSCSSKSSSVVTITVTVIVVAVVLVVILCLVFYMLFLRQAAPEKAAIELSALPNAALLFNSRFGATTDGGAQLPSTDSKQQSISEYVTCSVRNVAFAKSSDILLLNKLYTANFKIANETKEQLEIKLFTDGFKEKHDIEITPCAGIISFD